MIGDDGGNWIIGRRSDGDFDGMRAGHVTPELTKRKVKGGDAESKSLLVQFLDRLQFDENYEILHAENLSFTPQEVPQVNGVTLAFGSIPADAETNVNVTAVLSSDNASIVEGLLVADFLYTVDGVEETPSAVVETTPGVYDLTVTALATAGVVAVTLQNAALSTDVTDSGGVLYASDGVSEIVVV